MGVLLRAALTRVGSQENRKMIRRKVEPEPLLQERNMMKNRPRCGNNPDFPKFVRKRTKISYRRSFEGAESGLELSLQLCEPNKKFTALSCRRDFHRITNG